MRILTAAAFIALASSLVAAQAQPDTKGWHGAEWGMTPAQAAAATQMSLSAPVPADQRPRLFESDPEAECRTAPDVAIGALTATPKFCFAARRDPGLAMILLEVRETSRYAELRAELKARYGEPTSEETFPGRALQTTDAKWLLPSTEIALGLIKVVNMAPQLTLVYTRRTVPIL